MEAVPENLFPLFETALRASPSPVALVILEKQNISGIQREDRHKQGCLRQHNLNQVRRVLLLLRFHAEFLF